MQAYPGRDPLNEVLTGQITTRKFSAMVRYLPPGNVAALELSETPWGDPEWLAWTIAQELRHLREHFINVHRDTKQNPEPIELPRIKSPQDAEDETLTRTEETEQARQHLQNVLGRSNPH